jgi:hypothetical protein
MRVWWLEPKCGQRSGFRALSNIAVPYGCSLSHPAGTLHMVKGELACPTYTTMLTK